MKFHISQNTPVVIITNAVKGNSNCEKHLDEIHDNNEDTIEDGVRNIRGDIVIEKVFGFYRTARNDSDDVRNFELVKNVKKNRFFFIL